MSETCDGTAAIDGYLSALRLAERMLMDNGPPWGSCLMHQFHAVDGLAAAISASPSLMAALSSADAGQGRALSSQFES
jgi:hypothetical protein